MEKVRKWVVFGIYLVYVPIFISMQSVIAPPFGLELFILTCTQTCGTKSKPPVIVLSVEMEDMQNKMKTQQQEMVSLRASNAHLEQQL
jgi:hypothetical protein